MVPAYLTASRWHVVIFPAKPGENVFLNSLQRARKALENVGFHSPCVQVSTVSCEILVRYSSLEEEFLRAM